MKIINTAWLILLGAAFSLGLQAQPSAGDAPDEDTIMVLEEGAQPDQEFEVIALPERAADSGRDNAAQGLETANQARQEGRELGRQIAEEARSANPAEEASEQLDIEELRDNRPDDMDQNLPDLPDTQDRPEAQERPDTPDAQNP